MRLFEFQSPLKAFTALVRVKHGGRVLRTLIYAESSAAARQLAAELYGRSAVLGVTQVVAELKKPLTPDQLRVKSLNDQAKKYRSLAKQERARQALTRAKSQLSSTKSTG